jgi:dipeptidyl aminopeptidase/acylaminoacyl peptidase
LRGELRRHRRRQCDPGHGQSTREENALTDAHKKVRFVKLEGADHNMDHSDVRLAVLRETEAFLAANICN